MSQASEWERAFVQHLERLSDREERAALAALRRGLGKAAGEAAEVYPYVMPFLPADTGDRRQEAYFLVGSLFAWHPLSWRDGAQGRSRNLGASFARLAQQVESGSIEGRFVALLNSHRDDLPQHLRHAVGLLRSRDVPVDWAQLLRDLQGWDWQSRSVQRAWASAFWATQRPEQSPEG